MNLFKVVVTVFIVGLSIVDAKTPCQGCKDLVDGILKGLDTTKNKNFGGGDTAWEEKKNLKYKTSETRLVEILDSACAKDNFKCNELLSEREDDIEKWYKKLQDSQPLHDFLCVDTAAVCCPEGKFGEDCQACPQNDNGEICFGRGKCEGSGDKQGSGKCVCDEGYAGDKCSECGDRHFTSFSNDTYTLCSLCHQTCQTCTGSNATDCTTCRAGYREEHDQKTAAAAAAPAKEGEEAKEEEAPKEEEEKKMTCVDINECVEKSDLCQVGEYCANTEGSYKCEACHATCSSCFGPSSYHCTACKGGCLMKMPYRCQDIDECASGAICLGMYEVCVNTIGHYTCECARFFRRDTVTGQCQPDPAIYSRYLPNRKPAAPAAAPEAAAKEDAKPEETKEEEKKDEGEEKKAEEGEKEKEEDDAKVEDEEKKEEL